MEMIRTTRVLFCENEHGMGDVTFPDLSDLSMQQFIEPPTIGELRKKAKAEGWGRLRGQDYCPDCMEGGI